MKKYILLTVNLLILTALFAQKPSLTKAYNCFYDKVGRFPSIEEDEPPIHLLCNEYPEAHT